MGKGKKILKTALFAAGGGLLGGFLLPGDIGYVAGKGFFGSVKGWQVGMVSGLSLNGLVPDGGAHVEDAEVEEWKDSPCTWCGEVARENVTASYEMTNPAFLCLNCAIEVVEGKVTLLEVRKAKDLTRKLIWDSRGIKGFKMTAAEKTPYIQAVRRHLEKRAA